MRVIFVAACMVAGALLSVGCGKSAMEQCCDCFISNGCWSSDVCPHDPTGSCYYVRADGDLPSYTNGVPDKVCYAVGTQCASSHCPGCAP